MATLGEILYNIIGPILLVVAISFAADRKLELDSRALSRLLLVAENYPELKADQSFRALERRITDLLVAAEARGLSLRDNHGALGRVRRGQITAAANLYLREEVVRSFRLDSATIDTFYNNHITRYTSPRDQRRLRVLTVWKEGKAPGQGMIDYVDSVFLGWYPEDKIDSLYRALAAGEDFAGLAQRHSEDPITRGGGGDSVGACEFNGGDDETSRSRDATGMRPFP